MTREGLRGLRAGLLLLPLLALLLAACTATAPDDVGSGHDDEPRPTRAPSTASPRQPTATPCPSGAFTATTATVVRVIDGDTIEIDCGFRVRYIGIDTPETVAPGQPVGCMGAEASARNEALVLGKTVRLEKDVSETDSFGRLLRYVYVDGAMVNELLVAEGFAQSSTYQPDVKHQERLLAAQRTARENGRGLWGEACSGTAPRSPTPRAECNIKGNISSSSGERIFHVPGQRDYNNTVIDESKGERWFCSEEEAIAAGWRKALR